jgi:predicted acyltransferase (DUF342 family)
MNAEPDLPLVPSRTVLDEVRAENALVAGDVIEVDRHTWAVHGVIPVDGDVILAEFEAREQALDLLEQLAEAERAPLLAPTDPEGAGSGDRHEGGRS